jgi:hypothetical protein
MLLRSDRSLTVHLHEKTSLSLCEFHGCGTFLTVVSNMVDPTAYGIAPHQPSIAGPQQFGGSTHVPHPGIEPQVVAIWIEDDRHAGVDG